MIDINNKECRYIMAQGLKAQIDYYIMGKHGEIDRVMVWVGEYDPKTQKLRPHLIYRIEDCEEVEK